MLELESVDGLSGVIRRRNLCGRQVVDRLHRKNLPYEEVTIKRITRFTVAR